MPDWGFLPIAIACAGAGAFRLTAHLLSRRRQSAATASLRDCLEAALEEVSQELRLRRSAFCWNWLPFTASMAVCLGYESLRWKTPFFLIVLILSVLPLTWWGYRLNRLVERKVLGPRRRELEALLDSLN